MEIRNPNEAVGDFMDMIEKSWTWARLTEQEKVRFKDRILNHPCSATIIKGDYEERRDVCEALYHTYLEGMGYEPIGWRDPQPAVK